MAWQLTRALRTIGRAVPGSFPLVVDRVAPKTGTRETELLGSRFQLDLRDYLQRRYYYHCYERAEAAFLTRWLRPGDSVVDVGANVGFFSLLAARLVGPAGRVDAFEPIPRTFERLQANVEANGYTWVTLNRAAVSSSRGDVTLGVPAAQLASPSSGHYSIGGDEEVVRAQTITLDDYLTPARPVRLLKLDVEGHEPSVLAGARHTLRTSPPEALIVEVNHQLLREHGGSAVELMEQLARAGYSLHTLDRHGALKPAPSRSKLADACRRADERRASDSALRTGLRTRRTMFNVVAVRRDAPNTRPHPP